MTATITLFEHERIPFAWENGHLALLERLNTALGTEVLQATTFRGQRILKAAQHVGVVRLGRNTIQILPKIDYGEDRTQSATRNLLYLLEQVGQFPVRQHDITPLLQRGQNWFEILTRLFAGELKEQWQRGPSSHYQALEDNLPVLKGKWQINQQLRRPASRHRFDVVYEEFTADNRLNQVFRLVTERLWRQTRDYSNRRLLGELRQWLDGITLRPHLSATDARPDLITRLNRRFEPLLNLARLFLVRETLEMAAGDVDSFAFVFDMNQLFEAFLVSFIRRYRAHILPPQLAHSSLHPQARRHNRYLATTTSNRSVFRLKPDLAFYQANTFPLLVDAKYKKLDRISARLGVASDDFYQMFAYIHRYRCPHVLLIYPEIDAPLKARFTLEEHPATVTAVTVNLHRDLSRPKGRQALVYELQAAFNVEERDESTA